MLLSRKISFPITGHESALFIEDEKYILNPGWKKAGMAKMTVPQTIMIFTIKLL